MQICFKSFYPKIQDNFTLSLMFKNHNNLNEHLCSILCELESVFSEISTEGLAQKKKCHLGHFRRSPETNHACIIHWTIFQLTVFFFCWVDASFLNRGIQWPIDSDLMALLSQDKICQYFASFSWISSACD